MRALSLVGVASICLIGCKNPNRFMRETEERYRADTTAFTTMEEMCERMPESHALHYSGSDSRYDYFWVFTERYGKSALRFRMPRTTDLLSARKPLLDAGRYETLLYLRDHCK